MTWKPITTEKNYLPDELKFVVESTWEFPVRLSHGLLEYLQGLNDGGISGAQELIDAIRRYDVIEVTIVY